MDRRAATTPNVQFATGSPVSRPPSRPWAFDPVRSLRGPETQNVPRPCPSASDFARANRRAAAGYPLASTALPARSLVEVPVAS
jgi:hypothetical protein